ncbi:hypothetical protein TNCV_3044031 [Trichonephila clavipes]|nr:hypothetical protein TNCV_3044031 [Trichonephila clavipes]
MTNLGLKTFNVTPCYCHHNDMGDAEYHQPQHLPHHVAFHWLTHVLAETFLSTVLHNGKHTCDPGQVSRHSSRRHFLVAQHIRIDLSSTNQCGHHIAILDVEGRPLRSSSRTEPSFMDMQH